MSKDPPRTLRWLSTVSGFLLVIGGISGLVTINPLSAVISVYNIFFGMLIVLTELKNYPVIRTFQKRVDVWFHLLSIPRGKGGFYCFIGLLAFLSSDWGLSKICVFIVSIVGILHLCACKRCGAIDEEAPTAGIAPVGINSEFTESGGCTGGLREVSAPSGWSDMMKEVVAENPEMLTAGLRLAASNVTESVAGGGGGGSTNTGGCGSSDADASSGGGTTGSGSGAAADGNDLDMSR